MTRTPPSTQVHPPNPEGITTSSRSDWGVFVDDKWWCNCQPNRRPAALREVTKDTPNKGKFFWSCPRFNGCSFFLFWDEAKLREGKLQTSTTDGDQPPRPKTPTLTQPKLTAFGVQLTPGRRRQSRGQEEDQHEDEGLRETRPTSSVPIPTRNYPTSEEMASALSTATHQSGKRKRCDRNEPVRGQDDSSDDFSDIAVDSDDERQLIDLADQSAKKAATNRGGGGIRANGELITPEIGVRTIAGLPTPASISRNLFPSDKPRRKSVTFDPLTPSRNKAAEANVEEAEEEDDDDTVVGDSFTAAASFNSTATLPTADTPPRSPQVDPSAEILSLLSSHGVDTSTQQKVRNFLAISARRTRGVEKARDGLRDELRKQKSRNAKLQDKIAALEDKLKTRSKSVSNLKAGLMELYEEN